MWFVDYSNSPCNQFERFNKHKEHLEKLLSIKGKIDNKNPFVPKFFNIKASKNQAEKETKSKLTYSNSILFNNMSKIASKSPPYSLNVSKPKYCPALDKARFNWCAINRKATHDNANREYIRRYINSKTHYSFDQFSNHTEYQNYLHRNIRKKNYNPNLSFVTFFEFKQRVMYEMNIRHSGSLHQSVFNHDHGQLKHCSLILFPYLKVMLILMQN